MARPAPEATQVRTTTTRNGTIITHTTYLESGKRDTTVERPNGSWLKARRDAPGSITSTEYYNGQVAPSGERTARRTLWHKGQRGATTSESWGDRANYSYAD